MSTEKFFTPGVNGHDFPMGFGSFIDGKICKKCGGEYQKVASKKCGEKSDKPLKV